MIFCAGLVAALREIHLAYGGWPEGEYFDYSIFVYRQMAISISAAVIPLSAAGVIQAMLLLHQDGIELDWEGAEPDYDEEVPGTESQ